MFSVQSSNTLNVLARILSPTTHTSNSWWTLCNTDGGDDRSDSRPPCSYLNLTKITTAKHQPTSSAFYLSACLFTSTTLTE